MTRLLLLENQNCIFTVKKVATLALSGHHNHLPAAHIIAEFYQKLRHEKVAIEKLDLSLTSQDTQDKLDFIDQLGKAVTDYLLSDSPTKRTLTAHALEKTLPLLNVSQSLKKMTISIITLNLAEQHWPLRRLQQIRQQKKFHKSGDRNRFFPRKNSEFRHKRLLSDSNTQEEYTNQGILTLT